jgi:hypothetical protein
VHEQRAASTIPHELPKAIGGLVVDVLVTHGEVDVLHPLPPNDRPPLIRARRLLGCTEIHHRLVPGLCQSLQVFLFRLTHRRRVLERLASVV